MQRNSTLFSRMEDRVEFGTNFTSVKDDSKIVKQNQTARTKAVHWLLIEKYVNVLVVFVVTGAAYCLSSFFVVFVG